MTQPGRVPIERDRRALQPYLRAQRNMDKQLLDELARALKDAERHLKRLKGDGIGKAIRRDQTRAVISALKEEIQAMWRQILVVTFNNLSEAHVAAVDATAIYETRVFRTAGRHGQWEEYQAGLAAEARQGVETLRTRLTTSKIALASSVYDNEALSNQKIDRIVNSALARGLSARELAADVRMYIRPDVRGGVSYAAMRLARTELNNAFHARTAALLVEKPWVDATKWCLSGSHPKPDTCDQYAGRVHFTGGNPGEYRPGDVPAKPHPQCVPADALVTARDVRAVTKRWFEGHIVDITLEEGAPILSGTPNHPALTPRGWVPLGEIVEGDYVFGAVEGEPVVLGTPDYENVPTRIEEVFEAFNKAVGGSAGTMPTSAEDFHGDGMSDGEVHVVGAYGELMLPDAMDHLVQEDFAFLNSGLIRESGLGTLDFRGQAGRGPSDGFMRGLGHALEFFGTVEIAGLLAGPERGVGSPERSSYSADAHAEAGRDLAKTLTGKVRLNRVMGVSNRPFSGHVFNLQTESGYYTCNNNTVSNCLCFLIPVLVPQAEFQSKLLGGDYDGYLSPYVS